jgi:effector-binding domain-containing protein
MKWKGLFHYHENNLSNPIDSLVTPGFMMCTDGRGAHLQGLREGRMFKIGEFSRLCGLPVETLYHYEYMKLLLPVRTDKFTGYRYYEAHQLITVNKILALKDAGFSLIEIAQILQKEPTTKILVELLTEKALSLEKLLHLEIRRLERLHTNIFLLKNGGIPVMNEIAIKRVEPILMASIRKAFHKSRFDAELEAMWHDVNECITKSGGKRTIPCMMIYHTGWWNLGKDELLDVEVVEPITSFIPGSETVVISTLPAVEKMACIVHKGPFDTIWKTSDSLFAWIKDNGYKVSGPVREIYHKGDWATDDPNEYITELQAPVQ